MRAYIDDTMPMPSLSVDRFVRLPTALLEELLLVRLTATEWRVLLLVIRHTFGWNRPSVRISWYRIARQLRLNRGTVYRAGQKLLAARILLLHATQLSVQTDSRTWANHIAKAKSDAGRQPGMEGAAKQRSPLLCDNGNVADRQRERSHGAAFLRGAKDSSIESLKTLKDNSVARTFSQNAEHAKSRYFAGAAAPIPGKYDRLSEN